MAVIGDMIRVTTDRHGLDQMGKIGVIYYADKDGQWFGAICNDGYHNAYQERDFEVMNKFNPMPDDRDYYNTVAGAVGLEPTSDGFGDRRSTLSYAPNGREE